MSTELKSFLSITTTRRSERVAIDGQTYEIREMNGTEFAAAMSDQSRRVKLDAQGNPTPILTDYKDLQTGYVARCLYWQDDKGVWTRVPLATINEWPASGVAALYDACQKVNGGGKGEEKKPSPPTTEPGSE